jgi:hypothetical protein
MAAIAQMLASAPDVHFEDPYMTSVIVYSVLAGPIRASLDGHLPAGIEAHFEGQLVRLLTAYLQTYRLQP